MHESLQLDQFELFATMERREILLHQIMRRHYLNLHQKHQLPPTKKVSIIVPTNKLIFMENIFANYQRQLYPEKELIIILNNNQLDLEKWRQEVEHYPQVQVYQLDESTSQGQCLNYAVSKATGDYMAKMDDDDYYGAYYLTDQVFCFSYVDADVVGKASQFAYIEANQHLISLHQGLGYQYVHHLPGGTFLIKREVFDQVQFQDCSLAEDVAFNNDCTNAGFRLYAAGPFNFLRYRRVDKNFHTWRKDDEYFLEIGNFLTVTDEPDPLISK